MFVAINPGESIESALKRFKKSCEREGLFQEIKKHERYQKPSVIKNLKRKERQRKLKKMHEIKIEQDKMDDLFDYFE